LAVRSAVTGTPARRFAVRNSTCGEHHRWGAEFLHRDAGVLAVAGDLIDDPGVGRGDAVLVSPRIPAEGLVGVAGRGEQGAAVGDAQGDGDGLPQTGRTTIHVSGHPDR